jgi:translocation and assembly module TamB
VLLLTIGITRAEADQIQAGTLGMSVALEALSAISGASNAVKSVIPVIDDFKFGSAYSPLSGRSEPTVRVGKRITKDVSANVETSLSEDRELRANIMWKLGQNFSVQGTYDNVNNDVTSSAVGNLGVDLRWRVEFQ